MIGWWRRLLSPIVLVVAAVQLLAHGAGAWRGAYDALFLVPLGASGALKSFFLLIALTAALVLLRARDGVLRGRPFTAREGRWVLLLLIAAGGALYLPVLTATFLSDDFLFLGLLRDHVAGGHPLELFRPIADWGFYRPVMLVSLGVDYAFFGTSPLGYHLHSLSIHLLCAWGLYLWSRGLWREPWTAAGLSLLFVAYPLHVEAVTWVSARAEPLMLLFALLSLIVLARDRGCRGGGRAPWSAVVFFLLALGSKESALAVPLLALVAAGAARRPLRGRGWLYGAMVLVVPCYLGLRAFLFGGLGGYPETDPRLADVTYGLLGLMAFPWRHDGSIGLVSGMVALGALVAASFGSLDRRRVTLALLWVGYAFLPAIPFFRVEDDLQTARLVYTTSVGFLLVVVELLRATGAGSGLVGRLALVALLCVFVVLTRRNLEPWTEASRQVDRSLAALAGACGGGREGDRFVILGDPDSWRGAYLFRNGLASAIRLQEGCGSILRPEVRYGLEAGSMRRPPRAVLWWKRGHGFIDLSEPALARLRRTEVEDPPPLRWDPDGGDGSSWKPVVGGERARGLRSPPLSIDPLHYPLLWFEASARREGARLVPLAVSWWGEGGQEGCGIEVGLVCDGRRRGYAIDLSREKGWIELEEVEGISLRWGEGSVRFEALELLTRK